MKEKKYRVFATETIYAEILVKAKNQEEAEMKAKEIYDQYEPDEVAVNDRDVKFFGTEELHE